MNLNEKVLARVKPISQIGNELVIGCMKVTHFINGKSIKASLLATEFEFILMEKVTDNIELQVCERFFWDELTIISAPSDLRIKLETANRQVEIEVQGAFAVALAMHTCCARLGGKCKLDSERIKPKSPTSLWNLYKFKYTLFKLETPPPQCLINRIECALRQNSPKLDLNKINCPDIYLSNLLDAFVDANCFKEIVFPASETNSNWNLISPFLKSMKHYETVTFTEKLNSSIPQVCNALSNNKESKLITMSFIKNGINADTMPFFTQLISCRRISKLILNDAVEASFMDKFVSELSRSDAAKIITTITITDMPTLNVDYLMKSLPNVKIFEFRNCQVLVDSIFQHLSNKNLQGIIIDGGLIVGKELDKIPISQSLSNFTFSHCRWENYSFISMWCRILNHMPQNDFITMDLSYAQAVPQVWHSFFQAYCNSPSKNIKSINWSGNQISPVFLQFVGSCQNLSQVCFDSCFSPQSATYFTQTFGDLMKSNSYINELVMRSYEESPRADSSLTRFIDALCSNQSITYLDLSGQPLGDSGLASLSVLLSSNKKIRKLKFDGSLNVTIDSLQQFFSKVTQRGTPIEIEWPFKDVAKLRYINGIPPCNINKLRSTWKYACTGKHNDQLTDLEEEPDSMLSACMLPDSNPPYWRFDLPPIPEPENLQILQKAAESYSLTELLKLMRKE